MFEESGINTEKMKLIPKKNRSKVSEYHTNKTPDLDYPTSAELDHADGNNVESDHQKTPTGYQEPQEIEETSQVDPGC
ncbi:11183_t:CDS:2 [Dentiscutata erythropus]|uniref:11183_t:CDS:1 n=1 Tax=Dentiscutata erythropus TaxID=1348616 RepID=A0A9N9HFH6_9GLOM|nr:11183_t:CDS:2 [Dentiscutata erythropus]